MHMKLKEIQLLQFPKQLTHLSFNDTKLESVSQFCELEYLLHLEIANNNINNISDLAKLDKLQHLVIRNNKVSDISVLENLLRLKHFDASLNKIADLQVFAENTFESLEYLNLSCNKIDDISALTQYLNNGLIQHVDLSCNQLWDVSNVSLHRNTSIRLCNNYICDYNNLLQSESFQYEFIGAQKVPDSKFIKSKILTGKKVNVAEKREQLSQQFNESWCNAQLVYQKYIQYNYTQNLTGDTFVAKDNDYIQDLQPLCNWLVTAIWLQQCTNFRFSYLGLNVTQLTVMQSKISSISGIESMVQLQILDLSENEIRDIYTLRFLINLQSIDLRQNQILFTDSVFTNMNRLKQLNLSCNKLSDTELLPAYAISSWQLKLTKFVSLVFELRQTIKQNTKININIQQKRFDTKWFKNQINHKLNGELQKLNQIAVLFVSFFADW
ncbi:leucine_Rich Repeat (LRR)-containing protein [Hexamita inflata]|uniref:Leucine Rich Repeat (LRR)-containing protein n=1 Tax=Hexamita inflata TaxID=28002 RepID=A0AA86UY16_9EUKA|nr:leucine Rich Repeat (LRR)-containing protein [Hexamita inflata]